MRIFFFLMGWLATGLGVLGIFLPLLPTTPFILLAAACFARSSSRFYDWLINHPQFGHTIRHYRAGNGIPRKAKIYALTLMWLSISFSALVVVPLFWVKILLFAIAIGVSAYLISLPTLCVDER